MMWRPLAVAGALARPRSYESEAPKSAVVAREPARAQLSREEHARLKKMIETRFDAVWRTLRRLGVPAASVDDVAQNVFLQVAAKLSVIDVECERAYVYSVAVRLAADGRRSQARERQRFDEADVTLAASGSPSPEEQLENAQERRVLDAVLEAMDDELRTTFVLSELEGMTGPEIADALDLALGTVASRLRRAREQFRRLVPRIAGKEMGRHE